MVGARSIVGTAVGSRPKLNTVSTRAVNTSADTMAVRVRNSSSRSLRATLHTWLSQSPTARSESPPLLVADLGRPAPAARREVPEPSAPLQRHTGGQRNALVHVVRCQHDHAARPAPPGQQR